MGARTWFRMPRHPGRWWLSAGVVAVGVALSLLGFRTAERADRDRAAAELELRTEWRASDFQRRLLVAAETAEGVAIYMAAEGDVSAARFHAYAKLAHADDDLNSALYWSPVVRDSERDAFVAWARREVSPDYDIREIAPDDRFVAAARRDVYLPQLYEESYDETPGVAGFDLNFRPARKAELTRVRDEGLPLATPPYRLLMGGRRVPGFIVLWPVFGKEGVPPTLEERRGAFRGIVTARFRLDRFLIPIVADMPRIEESIEIAIGADAKHAEPTAWFDPANQSITFKPPAPAQDDGGVTFHQSFTVLGQTWVLASHFAPGVIAGLLSGRPWSWLIAGLLLTAIATAATWRQTGRIEVAEEQVSKQAGELSVWDEVFRNAAVGIAVADAADNTVRLANPAFATMLGRSVDELRGRPILSFYPEEEQVRLAALAKHRDEAGAVTFESRHLRKDGSSYPVEMHVSVVRDAKGDVLYRIASAFDITERKRTEAELSRSRRQADELLALLDTLQAQAPIGLGFVDRDYRYARVNDALAAINGPPAADHIGRRVEEIVPELWPQLEPIYRNVLADGRSYVNIELHGNTSKPADKPGDWLASLYPVRVAGAVIGIGIIVVDISRQRRMEEQLRQSLKMEAVGNLTGGLAHDFNNLLGVVIGNLDLVEPLVEKDADIAGLVDDARAAALHGAELTRRLLAFARRQPLQPNPVEPNELVSETAKLLSRTLGENIEITLELGRDVWPILVDAAQLQAALLNLSTNARDAMPSGGRLMIATGNRTLDEEYAATHAEVVPGDYTMIEVSDNGTGMTPEILRQVFEPFFTTKAVGQGTGLGLSMVFGFVKQSGGHVSVYSEPGVGTTFRLYLPRAEHVAQVAPAPVAAPLPRATGETVLAVEDNEALRLIVVRQLEDLGYRVIEADGAAAALAALETAHADLLFTDIVMPGTIDGFALAKRVLAEHPDMKVLLTSGFPDAKINGNLGEMAGSARLLGKPYRKDELARLLREVLDQRAPQPLSVVPQSLAG